MDRDTAAAMSLPRRDALTDVLRAAREAVSGAAQEIDPVIAVMERAVQFLVEELGLQQSDALALVRRLRRDGATDKEPPLYHKWAAKMREAERVTVPRERVRIAAVAWAPVWSEWEALRSAMTAAAALTASRDAPDTWGRAPQRLYWKVGKIIDSLPSAPSAMIRLTSGVLAVAVGTSIRVYDVEAGAVSTMDGHQTQITQLVEAQQDTMISFSVSTQQNVNDPIRVWDTKRRVCAGPLTGDAPYAAQGACILSSATDQQVAITSSTEVKLWSTTTFGFLSKFSIAPATGTNLRCVVLGGRCMLLAWHGNNIYIVDVERRSILCNINMSTGVASAHLVNEDTLLCVRTDATIAVFDIHTASCRYVMDWRRDIIKSVMTAEPVPRSVAFTSGIDRSKVTWTAEGGNHFAVCDTDGSVRLYQWSTKPADADTPVRLVSTLSPATDDASRGTMGVAIAAALGPSHALTGLPEFIVTAHGDKNIRMWVPVHDPIYNV